MKNSEEVLNEIYIKALDLVLNRKLKAGEELLEGLYNNGNINIDILNILGIIKYLYCNFEKAKDFWSKSLEISNENNKAIEFLRDINENDFSLINKEYIRSLELIENKNYLKAIEILEEISRKRIELIEVKEILALLYMIIGEKTKGFEYISSVLKHDISNNKTESIYNEIKSDLDSDNESNILEFTYSESILNLIMILNYRINSFYEEELKYRNDEIKSLYDEIKNMNLEIEELKQEKEEVIL